MLARPTLAVRAPRSTASRAGLSSRGLPGATRRASRLRAGDGETDLADKLKKAEEEAARLRDQLSKAQGGTEPAPEELSQDELAKEKVVYDTKIDGTSGRMGATGMGNIKGGDWLSEADLSFFTGDSPQEDLSGPTGNEDGTVSRRLLIGGGLLSAVVFAAYLTPPRIKPSQPLFFYLIPTLSAKTLLQEAAGYAQNGDVEDLKAAINAVQGSPNNLKENMLNAAACLESDADYKKADALAREVAEYVTQADFNKYYGPVRGAQAQEFLAFSLQSIRAAESKLDEFLAVIPRDDIYKAKMQLQL